MPHVSALYRYPVKGLTEESVPELRIQDDGKPAGDRVAAFRFATSTEPEDDGGLDSWPKSKGLCRQDFPTLARLHSSFDPESQRLGLTVDGELLVEAALDEDGRREIETAVTDWLLTTTDATRLRKAGRLPLSLVGDGRTPRFQDRARGYVSVHSAASVRALAEALPHDESASDDVPRGIDSRRFRSNVVLEDAEAFAELSWSGTVTIGEVEFRVCKPIVRCLATHANPDTGLRDASVLKTLTRAFDQAEPSLGVLLLPTGPGGVIRVGDEVQM